jgi:hypothetical protein
VYDAHDASVNAAKTTIASTDFFMVFNLVVSTKVTPFSHKNVPFFQNYYIQAIK